MALRKKIALKDIARELGVSTALVSYVLNDKFTNRINPETARRIRDLADELQYHPNQIAKSLKNSKTFTIGLIIADISNLFYSGIARVIEDEAKKHMYNVIFGSADENPEKFKDLIQVFVSRQVDGLILASPEGSEEQLQYLKEKNIPFVLIDRYFPALSSLDTVIIDNYRASYDAVEHFAERGYKYPVMINLTSGLAHLIDRSNGFRDASLKHFGKNNYHIVEIQEEALSERIEEVISELLPASSPVDSVFFSTNKIALEGLAVLAKLQKKIPQELGVICFDEADAYKLFSTSVSFVKQPLDQIGREAVEILLERGVRHADPINIVLQTSLVTGNSSAGKRNTGNLN